MWAGPLGLAGVATLGVGGRLLADLLIARRAARARDQAADAVALVAAELCAGSALPEALRAAVQVAPAHADTLAAAARAADRGDDAGAVLVGRAVDGAVFALGHALRVAGACGAGVADVLGRVGDHLAGRAEVRRGVATALAGPRASCALLAGLPVLGIVMGSAMGAHPARFLLADPAGQWVAGAGALLDVVGVLWVRALVRRAAPP
jgi:tight adherence protein B